MRWGGAVGGKRALAEDLYKGGRKAEAIEDEPGGMGRRL